MLLDTDKIKKGTFRSLVIGLFISFAYDVFWLLVTGLSLNSNEAGADGGVEKSIRSFSLSVSVISMLFRVNHRQLIQYIGCGHSSILERLNRFSKNY